MAWTKAPSALNAWLKAQPEVNTWGKAPAADVYRLATYEWDGGRSWDEAGLIWDDENVAPLPVLLWRKENP